MIDIENTIVDAVKPVDLCLKNIKDIKRSIIVEQSAGGVWVTAVAIHKVSALNSSLEVSLREGKLLTQEVYHIAKDCAHISGVDKCDIGLIPVSYVLKVDDCVWKVPVPLSLAIIKQNMSETQKNRFERWRNLYKSKSYTIQFVQVNSVY